MQDMLCLELTMKAMDGPPAPVATSRNLKILSMIAMNFSNQFVVCLLLQLSYLNGLINGNSQV